METRQFVFRIQLEADPDVRWYTLAGKRHGPFLSARFADLDLKIRLEMWVHAARRIGGSVFRRSLEEVVVTLPKAVLTDRGSRSWPWAA